MSVFSICIAAFVVGVPLVAGIIAAGWPMIGAWLVTLAFFGLVWLGIRLESR